MVQRKPTRIQKRERMEKLFDNGRMLVFTVVDGMFVQRPPGDEQEDDMRIWVRPANPLQRGQAIAEAQAAQARVKVAGRDSKSREWLGIRGFLASLSDEALAAYVVALGEEQRVADARREVLKDEEWKDFNQLRDAMRQYEEAGSPKDDPEWEPLLRRDDEFGEQVLVRADQLRDAATEAAKLMPRDKLEERAFERRLDEAATNAFVDAYGDNLLFYACRDDENHNELFFDDVNDMKRQPDQLQNALRDMMADFITDAAEAKNSQGAALSSTSSVPPDAPEISESSTPTG